MFINAFALSISLQNDNFQESNEFFGDLLRGIGITKIDPKKGIFLPPLRSNANSTFLDPETTIRAGIQSEYSVPGWFDTRWQYRKNITIDHNEVDGYGNFPDFPVLIDITDSDLVNNVQVSGNDILFVNSTGHKLDHEIESY